MVAIYRINYILICAFSILLLSNQGSNAQNAIIEVFPASYDKALRNPLKGFTTRDINDHEWATLAHTYIKWNEIENKESDGINKIIEVVNSKWKDVELKNTKIIPRIYLHWDGNQTYWPSDMITGDYSSDQFKERVVRLIRRLGVVWDTDPRVAFIEMGIFGKWGEQHSPFPTTEMQTIVASAIEEAFPNKLVSVRRNWERFQSHPFGEYWDSWGHYDQMWQHGNSIAELNNLDDRYKTNYIGGEAAYNWGNSNIQPGVSPTETVSNVIKRDFMINSIRWLHCTQLRWISDYDSSDSVARYGADLIQKAFGYRYNLEKFAYSSTVTNGELQVSFDVKNMGSAPFYYNWPVEVSLLDTVTHEVIWSDIFESVDIRNWMPGDSWDSPNWIVTTDWPEFYPDSTWSTTSPKWATPPITYQETQTFNVTASTGTYIIALAVLDPAGMQPSLRFATSQYFTGGRHPMGMIAINQGVGSQLPATIKFDDPALDNSLQYTYEGTPVLGFKDDQFENIKIYPNPAQNYITISSNLADIRFVEIIDIFGKQIFQKNIHHKITDIDVSMIQPGLYFIRTNNRITNKIIIK